MLKCRHPTCTHLRSAPAGLNGKNLLNKGGERADDKIHTCNVRVWTEVKGTIVILGWVGTVGRNILLNFHSEIEVVDHILRDRTAVCLEGGRVGRIIVTRELETFDVGRVDYGVVAATVSHIARGEGSFIFSSGARDINQKTGGTPGTVRRILARNVCDQRQTCRQEEGYHHIYARSIISPHLLSRLWDNQDS